MKNAPSLTTLFLALLLISACKKESKDLLKPDSEYPTNYLQVGNYWIYENHDNTRTPSSYIDSLSVEAMVLGGVGDTFYNVGHYDPGGSVANYREALQVSASGILRNYYSKTVIVDYSPMPINIDSSSRGGGCSRYWGSWEWSSAPITIVINEDSFTAMQRFRPQYVDDCFPFTQGSERYTWVRGVGLARYDLLMFNRPVPTQQSSKLVRFFVKH